MGVWSDLPPRYGCSISLTQSDPVYPMCAPAYPTKGQSIPKPNMWSWDITSSDTTHRLWISGIVDVWTKGPRIARPSAVWANAKKGVAVPMWIDEEAGAFGSQKAVS